MCLQPGLRPRPHWGSLQCSLDPVDLREENGEQECKGLETEMEWKGRKGRKGKREEREMELGCIIGFRGIDAPGRDFKGAERPG